MKTALVSGGAGFLGSHLCDFLLNKNYQVVSLDSLYTGSENNHSHVNSSDFKFIKQDVTEPFQIDGPIDEIYNLACPASPLHYQKDPIYTWKTSVFGTYNLLNLAKEKKAKFLQASTSEVYGDPKVHPQAENYWGSVNPVGPRSCYDEGKRASETIVMDYRLAYKLDTKIVRIFNTYGPRMNPKDGRVVSNFIVQAIENRDFTVYGKGEQTRSFCFYSDLIEGIYKMMQSSADISGPVNLGNPYEFTILELVEKVKAATASNSKIHFQDLPIDDPKQRQPDISLAKKLLDWEPKVGLEEGLKATCDYFSKLLK